LCFQGGEWPLIAFYQEKFCWEPHPVYVLSYSGISTSVGIPDFRSKDGIYAQLQREGKYNLADPQEMFDKDFFLHDPSCFFSFAKSIFPSNFVPSPSHRFIKLLEDQNILLRNYTQNIDTLEQAAGIEKVLYCHGSFSQAQCTTPGCGYKVAGSVIKPDIFAQKVPYCPQCIKVEEIKRAAQKKAKAKSSKSWDNGDDDDDYDESDDEGLRGLGVMKPCITFFGEKLSDEFDLHFLSDRNQIDLLIVMGTSLKVAPVSELVGHIPHRTPVILINKTPVLHMGMDIQLLGDADVIVEYICKRLKWTLPTPEPNKSVVGGESVAEEIEESGTPKDDKDEEPKQVADR
jgi:NAD-dependent histone deacetylase SIR2